MTPTMTERKPSPREAVILVGHGGVPSDYPREKVRRLMTLESQRRPTGAPMGAEEAALDAELRNHPRTPETDPYQAGIERLARSLRATLGQHLPGAALYVAYNEFCAPSVDDAVAQAVADGAEHVHIMSTMLTPGGSHAEEELPELVTELQAKFPQCTLTYAWPVDLDAFAGFLVQHLLQHRPLPSTAHTQMERPSAQAEPATPQPSPQA